MHYLWWIPCVVVYYAFYAWLTGKNNEIGGTWSWYLFLAGVLPLWVIISRISTRLYFDGMLYDVLAFLAYNTVLILLGAGSSFTAVQWLGAGFVTIGFLTMMCGGATS